MRAAAETCRHHLDADGSWVHGQKPARHHRVWIERITALVEGRSAKRKLLILAPPGHAKSTWVSLIFPPWYLGNHPDESILFFTSADTMARQFGGTVKGTLEASEKHMLAFPNPRCRPDQERGWSSDGLYLVGVEASSKDPSYRAVGYGASVVGGRAHGIILDDPLTQEQAQSAVHQLSAKTYHDMTVDSRLHPQGWEIAIMTRWHEADLASHLMGKADWDTLVMPAIGEYAWGEALWPERFPLDWLEAKRADIGGPLFSCLYQADPSSLGGQVFKEASWFRPLPADFDEPRADGRTMRQRLRIVQFWDLAYSAASNTTDYTAACTLGVDASGNLYVLSVLRKRLSPQETEAAMVEQIGLLAPNLVGVEEAAFRQAATKDLVGRVLRKVRCAVRTVKPSADKVARALLPAARAEAGMVYADTRAPWFQPFLAECMAFPLGQYDDQVDALSGAAQLAVETVPPKQRQIIFGGG